MSIEKIIKAVLEEVKVRRQTAGLNGEWHDGGASKLEEQVKFYNYGRNGIIPPEWIKYTKELDPEYKEYVRLKKKFE